VVEASEVTLTINGQKNIARIPGAEGVYQLYDAETISR